MKKLMLMLLCLLALVLPALAEPMVSGGGYTAYLGQNNHMYLQDPLGTTKVLRYPIADLISVRDGNVYAIAQDGRLFAVRLDGSQTLVLSDRPTEADVLPLQAQPVYELTEGALYALRADGTKLLLATSVTAAAANEDRLFFITQTATGVTSLKALMLTQLTGSTAPYPTLLGMGVENPVSMTATADALAVVAGADRSVTVVSLIDMSRRTSPAASANTERAVAIGTEVLRYAPTEKGGWLVEPDDGLPTLTLVDAGTTVSRATAVPTATPTPTPRITATPRPTATHRPTATPEPEEAYPQLSYGDKGAAVRTLQRRLNALGYPVGKVDGTWGKNTQLAVNLFQCAIGFKERSYASSAMQERLYSRNAPQYDPYAPLREGDEGTDVKLMQKALFDLGYLGFDEEEEVDGKYGPITTQAIIAFQAAAGTRVLAPTGYADADTLMLLYSDYAPRNPALSQPTDPNYPEFIVPDVPSNPNYPEFIVPDTPSNPEYPDYIVPEAPVTTTTDLVVCIVPHD